MILKKITTGTVVQEFDTETGKFVSQRFEAGDQVVWEKEDGDKAYFINEREPYLAFDMKQPGN